MVYITLVCAMGMSTGILTKKMQEAAQKKGIDVHVIAMSHTSFHSYEEKTDILLLGPQVSHMEDELKKKYEPQGIKVSSINMMDYGMLNGEKVLNDALELIGK